MDECLHSADFCTFKSVIYEEEAVFRIDNLQRVEL